MPRFDLLIRAGDVIDPGQGLHGRWDLGIRGGVIAAVERELPASEAARVIDAARPGRHVLPGLIDIHTHVARGAAMPGVGMACADPDQVGVQSGVTTLADCGTLGIAGFGLFAEHLLPRARTRIVPIMNIGSHGNHHGMPGRADVDTFADVDPPAIAAGIERNPGVIQGIKLRLVGPLMHEAGERLASLAQETAKAHGLPLTVHLGESRESAGPERMGQITRHVLRILEAGDIVTHLHTPHDGGVLDAGGGPVPELWEARERGVLFDAAFGTGHFSLDVARRLADAGFHPDTIATDMTERGRTGRTNSLGHCMAKLMAVGYSLEDVVRMTTVNAAAALRLGGRIGAIAVGREADLTILDHVIGRWRHVDGRGEMFTGADAFVPVHTVKSGILHAPYWGPLPWGWLPDAA